MPDQRALTERGRGDGDTERRILTAARDVFIRHGTAGARMQEIAEEAGVNQALLHYYYRSKERLAEAVFREAAGRLIPTVLGVLASADTLEHKVEQFVHIYIDTVRQHPFIPGYVLAELHHHPQRLATLVSELAGSPASPAGNPFIQRLGAQLRERAAAGTMRPIAPQQFFVNLLSLCVFPFVGRPLLQTVLGMDEEAFGRFLDERRAELPGFILSALRP